MTSSSSDNAVSIDFVVSRFAEKLDWLHDPLISSLFEESSSTNANRKFVYNKGINEITGSWIDNHTSIISLENVGRECHTFLHHIITQYDDLADVTICLPGSCMDANKREKTNKVITKVLEKHDSVFYSQYFKDVGHDLYSFHIEDWSGSNHKNQSNNPSLSCRLADNDTKPYGKWYQKYFQDIHISAVCWQSIFAVSRHHIHQHPVSNYQSLLDCISDHPNPEEGHFIERSWIAVFHRIPDSCIFTPKLPVKPVITRAPPTFQKKSSFADMLSKFKSSASSSSVAQIPTQAASIIDVDKGEVQEDDSQDTRKRQKLEDGEEI